MSQIPYLLALSCITGIHNKSMCPTQTPISNHQLKTIWDPTPFCSRGIDQSVKMVPATQVPGGCYINSKPKVDLLGLVGKKIRIAAIVEPPYVISIDKNGHSLEGTAKIIIDVLREYVGFDYEIVTPPDGVVGLYDPENGTWSGMLGMIAEKKADMIIQFVSMLDIRTQAFHFSRAFGEERWVILQTRPQETTDGDGLVAPFRTEVWWYLLLALVVMGPLCYVMVRLRCHAFRHQPDPELTIYFSLGHCIWFVFGALMKQGSVLKVVTDSSRVLFATWWIFVTILTAFYTANLTAYLTLSKIPIPYNSLDKIGYRDYWYTRAGDAIAQALMLEKTPNDTAKNLTYYKEEVPYPELYKLRWRLNQPNAYGKYSKNESEMVDFVRRNRYLMIDEQSRIERIIHDDFRSQSHKQTKLAHRCAFIMSRQAVLRAPYGFVYVNETIQAQFEEVVNKLIKGGMFLYWRRKGLPLTDPCSADSDFRERQLRNGDLMTTYYLCGTGYLTSCLTFIIEIIYKWCVNRKLKGTLVPMEKSNLSFYKGNLTVPAGAPTYFDTDKFLKNINGRDYIVMKTADGRTRLVPKNDGMQALQPVYQPAPPISYSFMS